MHLGYFIVVINHLLTAFLILQDFSYFLDFLLGKKTIHDNQIKAFGFDVSHKYGVSIHKQGLLKVYGLQESIAKALVEAWVSKKLA